MPINFFGIIATIIIAGVLLWALNAFPAIDPTMKQIARVLIILFVALVVLYFLFSLVGSTTFHGFAGPCH